MALELPIILMSFSIALASVGAFSFSRAASDAKEEKGRLVEEMKEIRGDIKTLRNSLTAATEINNSLNLSRERIRAKVEDLGQSLKDVLDSGDKLSQIYPSNDHFTREFGQNLKLVRETLKELERLSRESGNV